MASTPRSPPPGSAPASATQTGASSLQKIRESVQGSEGDYFMTLSSDKLQVPRANSPPTPAGTIKEKKQGNHPVSSAEVPAHPWAKPALLGAGETDAPLALRVINSTTPRAFP